MLRDDLLKQIDFNSPQWVMLETFMKYERENKVNLLIGAKTEDNSDQLRGAIQYIDSLLRLKEAARKAAIHGHQ